LSGWTLPSSPLARASKVYRPGFFGVWILVMKAVRVFLSFAGKCFVLLKANGLKFGRLQNH